MKTSHIVAVTVGTIAIASVGYALYFDSKRRNDPNFRRKLKKERKRAQKQAKEDEQKNVTRTAQSVEDALASINENEFPVSMEDREKFCMEQLSTGEALFTQGPAGYDASAICFYKALKVYPAPAELVMVYQKTIPPEVFTLVMGMLSMDVHKKQQKYYTVFPPPDMNVKVEEMPEGVTAEGQKVIRRGLVATRDFAAGETIYSETPIISSLEPSLEGNEFCHYCMKQIAEGVTKVPCPTCTKIVFCSETCENSASTEFHTMLCTNDSEDATKPELALYNYTKETNNKYPEMIAKFLVRMVHEETQNTGEEYNLFDHIERLRFLEVRPSVAEEKEIELLKTTLGSRIPGIEEFINEERYLTLKGKLLYNAYGLSTSLNPDLSVEPSPEQFRSVHDAPVVGAGFYRVTSYMSHSCEPNTKIAFAEHNDNMSVVATTDIKTGEELHVGFIDQKNGTLSTEQRRQELFQHYRFKCIGTKKPAAKGIPIAVPTTQRRMSAFSVKTANKALMTGYRDGGPQRRKSSASTQGHMSPPYSSKDEVELVGVLPGFESLVESEARRHRKSVEPLNTKDVKEHKPAKRKRGSKELDSPELQPVGSVKARRHSTVAASSSGMGLHSVPSIVITPQSTMAPPKRIRKLSLAGNSITLPTRSILAGAQIPARIALTSVRIGGKAEFTAKGMSIVFGTDKITLNINGNSTRILHSQLLLVEYYTASQIRIIQIATKEKLPGTSILSEIYDPVHASGKARKITLYSTEKESIILDNCSKLKNNGVDIDSLTDAAGEKLLALNSTKSALPCVQEQTEETLFMFPFKPNGKSKSIAVHAEDAQRLNEGQFLNDTLIEFGLKLLTKPVKGPANSYDSVKNWTSKVDIFSMKYIIVPIHEKLHWHLAIIANPGLLLKDFGGSSSDDSESSSPEDKSSSHLEPESLSNSVIDVDTDMDVDVNKVKGRVDPEE
ncbi:hypothetical protein CPC16_005504, partial [Podila verticillata]